MKKAFLIVTAVLLAVMLAGCNDIAKPEETLSNIVGYTDDGRAIVELELGVGLGDNTRAMHPILAAAAADYYEVVFFDNTGGKYYRTSWREGKIARLRIPTGNYNGTANYAYIFAGRYDDRMLLGVGKLTHVDGAAGTAITSGTGGTERVDFTVNALVTNVGNSLTLPSTGDYSTSTFNVTGADEGFITVNKAKVPVFLLGASSTANATFGFEFSDGTGGLLTGTNKTELQSRIIFDFANTTQKKFVTKPYAWPESIDDNPTDLLKTGLVFNGLPAAANGALPNPVSLTIATMPNDGKGKGGLCLLGIEIPVILANNTVADGIDPITWYFKGGLNNSLIDLGYDWMGMGGGVVIGSGNVLTGSGIIMGKDPTP